MARLLSVRLALAALLLGGCPDPSTLCQRGPASLTSSPAPLATVGREVRFDVTAPLIACASDAVHVEVEAYDDANAPVPVSAGTPTISSGLVTVTLSLTPPSPGVYAVKVFFEPSLGNVQLPVVVAVEPDVTPIDELFPSSMQACLGGLDRTTAGAVLCSNGADTIVYRAGVEVDRFPGAGLAVADDVAWTQTAQGVLERRVEADGGFVLEGQVAGFPAGLDTAVGEHTRTVALRGTPGGIVHSARWDADAGVLSHAEWNPPVPANYFVAQAETLWGVQAQGALVDVANPKNLQVQLGGPVGGVDQDGVWFSDASAVRLVLRPFDEAAVRTLSLTLPRDLSLGAFGLGSGVKTVEPRFVNVVGDDPQTLAMPVLRGGALGVELWRLPAAPRVIGRRWIILPGATPEHLRFLRRPEATP